MFKVKAKENAYPIFIPQQNYDVYDVRNDSSGYPHFLVYSTGMWLWKSAKLFEPI